MKKTIKILSGILLVKLLILIWIFELSPNNVLSPTKVDKVKSELIFDYFDRSGDDFNNREKADSIIANAILLNDFIGISSGIYKQNWGTYIANAGFKKKFSQEIGDKHTEHRIASISKSITAIAIMQLWEKDAIDLDVAIQKYLPEFPTKVEGTITIRQLLKHTSGIKHYSSMWDGISFTHYENMVEALSEFKHRPLSFSPGTGYEYTTYGYTILGAIIEKVTQQSYTEYMKANIFLPAGMNHTTVEKTDMEYSNKADLYIKLGKRYIKSPRTDLSVKTPGGGIVSTAEDLIQFGKAILENKLIDSTSLEMMISNTDTLKQGTPYGFGWFVIEDEKNGRIIQHGGSQSGCSSFFQIQLDQKSVVAALANNFGSDEGVYLLCRDLTGFVNNDNFSVNYFASQPNAILNRYVGSYKYANGVFKITKKGNQLYSQTKHYPPLPIFPKSSSEFFFRHFGGVYYFQTEDQSSIRLNFIYNEQQTLAERI